MNVLEISKLKNERIIANAVAVDGLRALATHCHEEEDAFAVIVASGMRTEDVMRELCEVLDTMGITHSERRDPQTKNLMAHLVNRHGSASRVLVLPIFNYHKEEVERRFKALSPSFVYVDEYCDLGQAETDYIQAILGRRRGVKGLQVLWRCD